MACGISGKETTNTARKGQSSAAWAEKCCPARCKAGQVVPGRCWQWVPLRLNLRSCPCEIQCLTEKASREWNFFTVGLEVHYADYADARCKLRTARKAEKWDLMVRSFSQWWFAHSVSEDSSPKSGPNAVRGAFIPISVVQHNSMIEDETSALACTRAKLPNGWRHGQNTIPLLILVSEIVWGAQVSGKKHIRLKSWKFKAG